MFRARKHQNHGSVKTPGCALGNKGRDRGAQIPGGRTATACREGSRPSEPPRYLHGPDGEQQVQPPPPHHERQQHGGSGQRQAGELVPDIELPQAAPGVLRDPLPRSGQSGAPAPSGRAPLTPRGPRAGTGPRAQLLLPLRRHRRQRQRLRPARPLRNVAVLCGCCRITSTEHRSVLLLEMLEDSLLCSQMTLKYFYLENYFGELLEFTQENNSSQGDRKVNSTGCCSHSLRSLSVLLPSLSFPP